MYSASQDICLTYKSYQNTLIHLLSVFTQLPSIIENLLE